MKHISLQVKHRKPSIPRNLRASRLSPGFTIVELLVVIVVIAILATISIVAYTGIQQRATEAVLQSDLRNASTELVIAQLDEGVYPVLNAAGGDLSKSDTTTYQYSRSSDGSTYCLTATSNRASTSPYYVSSSGAIAKGVCEGHSGDTDGSSGGGSSAITDGTPIQTITKSNCPANRTRAVDARDNRTYWVQKLADGNCWMLTNLAYAGGGATTHGDTVSLINGGGTARSFVTARYYVPSGANPTSEPANPSTATNGSGQYGYFYNWCAAMGAQASTSACSSALTPAANPAVSICPAGWRLPTGNGGEVAALNTAINSGSTSSDEELLSKWFAQRGGYWNEAYYEMGATGDYWTSTQGSAGTAYELSFNNTGVYLHDHYAKYDGFAVRCLAQ